MTTKLTILCENSVGRPFGVVGEHGFACFIESEAGNLLFDTGQGMGICGNAAALDKDLGSLGAIAISHGHYDHTGGLPQVLKQTGPVPVYGHPDMFAARTWSDGFSGTVDWNVIKEVKEHKAKLMEFIKNDFSITAKCFNTCLICFPHIHTDYFNRITERFTCSCEKGIQRNSLVPVHNSDNRTVFKVTDDGIHVILFTNADLIDTKPADVTQWLSLLMVLLKYCIFDSSCLMPGNTMFFSCSGNGLTHAIIKYHTLEAFRKTGTTINKGQPFTANTASGTYDSSTVKLQIYCPVKYWFIPIQTMTFILDNVYMQTTAVTNGTGSIHRVDSKYYSHIVGFEFSVLSINRITIDSEKGIEYFLCSWHLVFSSPLCCERRRSVSNEPNANFLFTFSP